MESFLEICLSSLVLMFLCIGYGYSLGRKTILTLIISFIFFALLYVITSQNISGEIIKATTEENDYSWSAMKIFYMLWSLGWMNVGVFEGFKHKDKMQELLNALDNLHFAQKKLDDRIKMLNQKIEIKNPG